MPIATEHARSIDEDARRRFERAWRHGTPRAIEEFLPPDTDARYLGTLEELVQIDLEFSWKSWSDGRRDAAGTETPVNGETLLGPPRVENYLQRFQPLQRPDVVQRLVEQEVRVRLEAGEHPEPVEYEERFPTLHINWALIGASPPAGARPAAPAPGPALQLPTTFGSYELRELVGSGGMGVVYRARQQGTDRDVALKIIRADRLSQLFAADRQTAIERFRVEARAAARIEHPGIATVYEVGETDGLPWYSMRLVRGKSLAELVRAGPVDERAAARYVEAAAAALQVAHDRGILHRDLKPHNILVDEATDAPVITDFGLAKLVQEDLLHTQSGELLGTPAYMAPEQVRDAASVTTRSDVYALGATLYQLLTGRIPFSASTAVEMLRQVLDDEPAPLRQHRPHVDRDLEVICLKCLEKDAARRYPSAAALADELQRWLHGEPITARPVGRGERFARWCRRNPLVAAALGLAVAGVLFGAGALGVGYVRTSQALHKSEESEQNARATVNDFFTVVSEDVLLNRPAMQPLRKELLDRALQHYREFLRERGDDPKLQAEIAATHYRIGRITELTDSYAAALPEYEQARMLQQQLLQREPDNDEYRQALGTTLNALGACLARLGQYSDALAMLQDALRLREQSVRANAGDNERRRLLANTVMNVGNVLKSLGQFDDARDHLTQSLELRSPLLLPATPDNRKVRRDQGMAWFNLANLEIEIADPGDAQSWADRHGAAAGHLWESIRLFDAHARETPDDLELRALLMRAYRLLGEACVELDDLADAGQAYAAAEDLARDLTRENPRVPPLKLELASLLTMRGQLALERHDLDGAADWFRGSHEVLQALDADGALPAEGFGAFVTSLRLLATVYEEQQDWPRALESLESAQTALERFVAAAPFDAQLIEWLEDVRADLERVRALAARGQ